MVLCEHFIYTSGIVNDKSGYQIISKSSGITNEQVTELENYLYPLGVNFSTFSTSKSFLILKEYVAFTKIRNIGISFDGRPDTIYSHTILMKKRDFEKFNNDSRIFDEHYLEKTTPVHLTPILIKEKKFFPDFTCIDELGINAIERIFYGLLNRKKILLVDIDSSRLIQSVLSLMPSMLKIVSYSTNVAEPKRQSKYNIIQIKKNHLVKTPNSIVIDKETKSEKIHVDDSLLKFCIEYILKIMNSKNSKKLLKIYHQINSITSDTTKKIIVGTSFTIILEEPYTFSKSHLIQLQEIIDEITIPNEIIDTMRTNLFVVQHKQESGEFDIEKILSKYNTEKLSITTIGKMFGELPWDSTELRNALFHMLVKKRIYDFKSNGSSILQKTIDRYYNNEIIRGFVEEPKLHFAFNDVFSNDEIKDYQKMELFSITIKQTLCSNVEFLEELFRFNVHNFENDDHVLKFNEDIRWVFSSKEFHQNFVPEKILKILLIIRDKLIPMFPRNKNSGTIDQKYYYLEEILNILLNMSRYLLTVRRFSLNSCKNEMKEFEHNLSEFLSTNSLPNTKPINWFNLDMADRVPSVYTWMLFVRMSYRCN